MPKLTAVDYCRTENEGANEDFQNNGKILP